MSIPTQPFLTAARRYVELGYRVCPCVPGTKIPLTRNGFLDATTDAALVDAWWQRWPTANIAIATDGLLLIETVGPHNPWLQDAPEQLLSLAGGLHADSPTGGVLRLFRQPEGRIWGCAYQQLASEVDIQGYGGMCLAEPSVINGQAYRWRPTLEWNARSDQLPEPPEWLTAAMDAVFALRDPRGCDEGQPIPTRLRISTLLSLGGSMRRVGMTEPEILAALDTANTNRCTPPLAVGEVAKIAHSVARYEPEVQAAGLAQAQGGAGLTSPAATIFSPAIYLCSAYPELRRPVIHGLLREGEVMNVIAAPKAGKSWLVLHLALAVAAGDPWLGYLTQKGPVLLIDNELHPETLANRIPRVAAALNLPAAAWRDRFCVHNLRGDLCDLYGMESYFAHLPADYFKVIILDAFYRFLPKDADENDNGAVAHLYNLLDRYALRLNCAFVLIHHTSKGLQSGRGVTDVGAGAGSQSRATDAHLILREHEQPKCLSVDAVARSWPPPMSFVIRQRFPIWRVDRTLNPADLKRPERRPKKTVEGQLELPLNKKVHWTTDLFLKRFLSDTPRTKAEILELAGAENLKEYRAEKLLRRCEDLGKAHRWTVGGIALPRFATVAQPPGSDATSSAVQKADTH